MDLYSKYKNFFSEQADCSPAVIVHVEPANMPNWKQQFQDPEVMLEAELKRVEQHILIGDDFVPSVRVQFGTGQIASVFGCDLRVTEHTLPAVHGPVVNQLNDIYKIKKPLLKSDCFNKLVEFTRYFLKNAPENVPVQHPDIQSPFNTAHLIRGNDILMDFYDDPAAVEHLLDIITDYMIDWTIELKKMISDDNKWFLDYGVLWKGFARISNCSLDMISPDFYVKYVLPRDRRFLQAVGGGRIHYCGSNGEVIKEFLSIPEISGLDFDPARHDFWKLCDLCPPQKVLCFSGVFAEDTPQIQKLLSGNWPDKLNIIIMAQAENIEQGKRLYDKLKLSMK